MQAVSCICLWLLQRSNHDAWVHVDLCDSVIGNSAIFIMASWTGMIAAHQGDM